MESTDESSAALQRKHSQPREGAPPSDREKPQPHISKVSKKWQCWRGHIFEFILDQNMEMLLDTEIPQKLSALCTFLFTLQVVSVRCRIGVVQDADTDITSCSPQDS